MFCSFRMAVWNVSFLQDDAGRVLFNALSVLEGVADFFAQGVIAVTFGIVAQGAKLLDVHLALCVQYGFVGGNAHHLGVKQFRFLVVAQDLAFQGQGEFLDDGGLDLLTLDGGKPGLCKFVRHLVTRGDSQVVQLLDVCGGGHANGQALVRPDVVHSLVSLVDADGHLVEIVDASPGGHHGVWGLVFVVGPDDQNGLGVKQSFLSEILAHGNSLGSHGFSATLVLRCHIIQA